MVDIKRRWLYTAPIVAGMAIAGCRASAAEVPTFPPDPISPTPTEAPASPTPIPTLVPTEVPTLEPTATRLAAEPTISLRSVIHLPDTPTPESTSKLDAVAKAIAIIYEGVIKGDFHFDDPPATIPQKYKDALILIDKNPDLQQEAEKIVEPTYIPTLTVLVPTWQAQKNQTATSEAKLSAPTQTPIPPTNTPLPPPTPAPTVVPRTPTPVSSKPGDKPSIDWDAIAKANPIPPTRVVEQVEKPAPINMTPIVATIRQNTEDLIKKPRPDFVTPRISSSRKLDLPTTDTDYQAISQTLLTWRFSMNINQELPSTAPFPAGWAYKRMVIVGLPLVNGEPVTNDQLLAGVLSGGEDLFRILKVQSRFYQYYRPRVDANSWNLPDPWAFEIQSTEVELKAINEVITSRDNLNSADIANGLSWRGTVNLRYILRSRSIKVSRNVDPGVDLSIPDPSSVAFTPWQEANESYRVARQNGSWSAVAQNNYAVPVIRG